MLSVKRLFSEAEADKIVEFLLSPEAFEHGWAPGEKDIVRKAPFESLKNNNHAYWYIEDQGKIVAAMGIRENEYKSGGYLMREDYCAVHKDYRRQGLGTLLLQAVETYVKERKGRYILIESCDTDLYLPARIFYEKHGYKKVGEISDYYDVGEGKIDYCKKLQ